MDQLQYKRIKKSDVSPATRSTTETFGHYNAMARSRAERVFDALHGTHNSGQAGLESVREVGSEIDADQRAALGISNRGFSGKSVVHQRRRQRDETTLNDVPR